MGWGGEYDMGAELRTVHIDRYYSSTETLEQVYGHEARKMAFPAEAEAFRRWRHIVRRKLLEITGMDRMEPADLRPETLESTQMDGYRRDKVLIETEQGVWMPFYVLIPDAAADGQPRAAVIAPHGHGSAGKFAVAGRRDIPAVV
jgi:hypothetical protein